MFTITLDKTQVQLKLSKLAEGLKDFSVPFEQSGTDLLAFFSREPFDTQGVATGVAWKRLAPSTLMAREKRRGHYALPPVETGKILVWTGKLRNGFTKTVAKTQLIISNTVDYFKYNQPSRRMLIVNKLVIAIVTAQINSYAQGLIV